MTNKTVTFLSPPQEQKRKERKQTNKKQSCDFAVWSHLTCSTSLSFSVPTTRSPVQTTDGVSQTVPTTKTPVQTTEGVSRTDGLYKTTEKPDGKY